METAEPPHTSVFVPFLEAAEPVASVVIISKDEWDLAETLTTLYPQCKVVGAECLVVDASSGRLDQIRQDHPWVRWINVTPPLAVKFSIPYQRNVGTRAATTPVIAFCDSGGRPDDGWLHAITAPLLDGTEHAVSGPIRSSGGDHYAVANDLPDGAVVASVVTANFAFRREAFDLVGGFDERFSYGSDQDFGWRIAKSGVTVRSVNRAVMGMNWGGGSRQLRRNWRWGRGYGRLFRLHRTERLRVIRERPETFIYPTLLSSFFVALVVAGATGFFWFLALWPLALLILVWRNRSYGPSFAVVLGHFVYGVAAWTEILTALSPRRPIVALDFGSESPVDALRDALRRCGVATGVVPARPLKRPAWAAWSRIHGTRVIQPVVRSDESRRVASGFVSRVLGFLVAPAISGDRASDGSTPDLRHDEDVTHDPADLVITGEPHGGDRAFFLAALHDTARALRRPLVVRSSWSEPVEEVAWLPITSPVDEDAARVGVVIDVTETDIGALLELAAGGIPLLLVGANSIPGSTVGSLAHVAFADGSLVRVLVTALTETTETRVARSQAARHWGETHQFDQRAFESRRHITALLTSRRHS